MMSRLMSRIFSHRLGFSAPLITVGEVLPDHFDGKASDHLHCRIDKVGIDASHPNMYVTDPLQVAQVLIVVGAAKKVNEPLAMAQFEPLKQLISP